MKAKTATKKSDWHEKHPRWPKGHKGPPGRGGQFMPKNAKAKLGALGKKIQASEKPKGPTASFSVTYEPKLAYAVLSGGGKLYEVSSSRFPELQKLEGQFEEKENQWGYKEKSISLTADQFRKITGKDLPTTEKKGDEPAKKKPVAKVVGPQPKETKSAPGLDKPHHKEMQRIVDEEAFTDSKHAGLNRMRKRYGDPPIIPSKPGEGAYFSLRDGIAMGNAMSDEYINTSGTKWIDGDPKAIAARAAKFVYEHEWGHFLDYKLGEKAGLQYASEKLPIARDGAIPSQAALSSRMFGSDEQHSKLVEKIRERRSTAIKIAIPSDSQDAMEERHHLNIESAFDDIAAALSFNSVGSGHSDSYWRLQGSREKEIFANAVSILASGDKNAIAGLRHLIPEGFKYIDQVLNG